ncbi:MAG: anti-sigma factor family protein [Prochlorotrichaceae cyanobacterium]|jgi:anti-sigma factor RsiW
MRNLSQWSSNDRYEWLSAYIDDELVPHDRQVVEQWLAKDPEYEACYRRLMRMRQGFEGLCSQNLAPLPQTSPYLILQRMPWGDTAQPCAWDLKAKHRYAWKQRIPFVLASVTGLGLALLWSTGLRQPWAEPIAQVQSPPEDSVAIVPTPLTTPATQPVSLQSPDPAEASTSATLLVSTHETGAEPGLTVALDQPFLALPPD